MPRSAKENTPRFFSRQVFEARRFYLQLRPKSSHDITVVSGGWERCAADYRINRKSFPYLALEYVAGGSGRLHLAGSEYPLNAGAVFAYGPHVPHEIESNPQSRLSKYFANFVGERAIQLLRVIELAPGQFRTVTLGGDVQKAFEDLLRAGQRTQGNTARLASLYLETLLLTIADAGEAPQAKGQRAFMTYSRCRQFLEQHFLVIATLEDAASACHVDVSYLCRLFALFARQTPYVFLQRLKMNRAAAMLESGHLLVREVADLLGMDAFHFSRVFKRIHGLSPSTFASERVQLPGRATQSVGVSIGNGLPGLRRPTA